MAINDTGEVKDWLDRANALKSKRGPWEDYWQQLADVMLPNQADFTTVNMPGEQRGVGIYDGTPRLALRNLATTIDGLIKPKSSSWFDVVSDDEELNEMDEAKAYYDIVKNRMWNALYHKDARFIQRSGEVDLALCCFGWGALWIEENAARNGLLFRSFHNKQVAFDENSEGVIDTVAVWERFNPRQALETYQKYKCEPSTQVKDAVEHRAKDVTFEFVKLVIPNTDYDARLILGAQGTRGKKYLDVLIDVTGQRIVTKGGYYEFPCVIPRWETSPGDIYPRSPGMMALPDANTLQAMGKTLLVGGQRAVDPPIWVLNDAILSPLRSVPGGVTVLDYSDDKMPIGTLPVATNLPIGREMQQDYRAQVEAAFFKNVFSLPIEGNQMTATEILARKEEFIRVIGPVFGRLETDYIGHIVERTFHIMERVGALPPRPDFMEKTKVTFRFQSPIQKAKKQMEIMSLGQALQFIGPLAEVQPEIMDNLDGDAIMRDSPEWAGLPMKWLRGKKQMEELRAARQQGQAAQTELAAAGPVTEAIKNVADASSMMNQGA